MYFKIIVFDNITHEPKGGPRGGPLVVPPILDTTLINLMQSSRNDLPDIFMRDTVNSDFKLGLIVILKKATSFEILIEKSKTFSKNWKSNMTDIRTNIVTSSRPSILVLFQSCATISRSVFTLKFFCYTVSDSKNLQYKRYVQGERMLLFESLFHKSTNHN